MWVYGALKPSDNRKGLLTVPEGDPVATSIEEARVSVQTRFEAVVEWSDDGAPRSFWAFEKQAWTLLLALGRALAVLFLARQAARPRPVKYTYGGERFVLRDERTDEVGTRFGKVEFTRRIGRRPSGRKIAADLVVDRELGLASLFSLGVVVEIARLYAMMPYETARAQFRSTYEWAPSPRAAMRMVDGVGVRARAFIEQAPPPEDDGEILVMQVDGGGAPMIGDAEYERRRQPKAKRGEAGATLRGARKKSRREEPKPRRTKGKKSKNAKVAFVAVIYTLRQTPDGIEGPINKRLIGTFDSHRALFDWLRVEAIKRGYGSKRTLFIADGSEHIWALQEEYFPQAEPCLDWYHLAEYLWSAGRSVHREGSRKLRAWVDEQKQRLRASDIAAVLTELTARLEAIPKTGPGNKGKRERLDTALGYLTKHQARTPYAAFIADDLDIGSGAIEGAIRNVVRMRLDGPGMRWGRHRSELLLHLRCLILGHQWVDFVDHLVHGHRVTLPAQPIPAQPYTAKPQRATA